MILIYSLMVKHLQSRSSPQLIPRQRAPRLARRNSPPGPRSLTRCDAMLVVTTATEAAALNGLPEPDIWLQLHRRDKVAVHTTRSTSMAGNNPCQLVLGYARQDFTQYERLSLAGLMLKDVAARRPRRIGIYIDQQLSDAAAWYEALVAAALAHSFAMPAFRSEKPRIWSVESIELHFAPPLDLSRMLATARATNLVRWLTALPPNKLNTRNYRALLQQLARTHRLSFRWFGEPQLKRFGAGAFLAVSQGNASRHAGIARLRYIGRRGRGPAGSTIDTALVGKGILFDTGGINLKPFRSMLDMHTDMSGSAVALASLIALSELRANHNAEAWLAITENNIGPGAYRPQDVVQACNGVSIQVIHSDAEGRMALADTLALAARAKPRRIIDFATLTGACVTALTERYAGVFSLRADLLGALIAAGLASGERLWAFPMDADFDKDIDSEVADIRQCAVEGKGDHIHAARFLKRFVPDSIPWAHIDLATATRHGGLAHVPTEVTGFGPRLVLQWLLGSK
jgi:leucyl aminopeptidase